MRKVRRQLGAYGKFAERGLREWLRQRQGDSEVMAYVALRALLRSYDDRHDAVYSALLDACPWLPSEIQSPVAKKLGRSLREENKAEVDRLLKLVDQRKQQGPGGVAKTARQRGESIATLKQRLRRHRRRQEKLKGTTVS